jgi:hypothetical protein
MSSRSWRYCRTRDLHEHRVLEAQVPLGHELAERAQPRVDALGVVEPVHAEHDVLRVAELLADLLCPLGNVLGAGQLLQPADVDGDRERAGLNGAAVRQVDEVAVGLVADPLAHQPDEVLRGTRALEPDHVSAEQALQDLPSPWQLLEQLGRRERDVQEEADPQVRPELTQHLRHQLELVVLDPDQGTLLGDLGGPFGEALVDPPIGVPPVAMELRMSDHVVVERPQGRVGEALVVFLDLVVRQ